MSAPRDTPAPSSAAQAGPSNRRDWKYFDAKLAELRVNDVENIIARGQILIEAHDELERGSYEATVKRYFDVSYARKLRIIAGHPIISNRAHVHALPPSVFTLYELTKLPASALREKLADGGINPRLERKTVTTWRTGERDELTVDGKTVEPKLTLAEKLKAAEAKIAILEAKLKQAGGSLFDLANDKAVDIGATLAEHMTEDRFNTAVNAARARYKLKRQKPAG
jgi:hypothetical protein